MTAPLVSIEEQKKSLRVSCMANRDGIAAAGRAEAARRLADIGIDFAKPPKRAVVSAYMAMGSEFDPMPLVERLAGEGHPICLPVVTPRGNPLIFRSWKPGETLVPRTWGLLEPMETAAVVEPDVLLVPLLAYDLRGVRLGYGGGYYDRTLKLLRSRKPVIAIGLAFGEQQLAEVPCAPYDQTLDWVFDSTTGPHSAARTC